jgi:hypothetical protein
VRATVIGFALDLCQISHQALFAYKRLLTLHHMCGV